MEGTSLDLDFRMLLHVLTFQFKLPTATVDAEAPSTQIIMRRMLENGWCWQRIAHACREFSYPTLYYLSSLRRHIPQHLSHSSCTDSACEITAGDVEPSHRKPNCRCDSIDVSMGEVVKTIESGGVPLIRVKRQDQPPGTVKLEIIRCTASSTYTAISHVWSDRQLVVRENTPNALPQCQLEHLDMILAQIPPSSGKGFRTIRTLHNKVHNILCDWGYVECPQILTGYSGSTAYVSRMRSDILTCEPRRLMVWIWSTPVLIVCSCSIRSCRPSRSVSSL